MNVRRTIAFAATVISFGGSSILFANNATADENDQNNGVTELATAYSGTDIMPVGVPQPLSDKAKDKLAAITAVGEAARGGDVEAAVEAERTYAERWDPAMLTTLDSGEASMTAPTSASLAVEHYSQNKGYYCGPASGYMILRFRHGAGYKSREDGSAPGQASLANAHHMNTEAKRKTDYASDDFSRGLNNWEHSGDWVKVPQPTVQVMKDSLVYSIGTHRKPFGVNAVEWKGGAHYNGHPNRTIGHWVVATGYSGNGASGTYSDPATSIFTNAKPSFTASTKWFTQFTSTNGLSL